MKKLLLLILTIILILPFGKTIKAQNVERIDDFGQIDNNGQAVEIVYEDKKAMVYYGKNGIDIICANDIVHLNTDFEVAKLICAGDINNDGYQDFMAYELSGEYANQVYIISGKDGQVLNKCRFTHSAYDDCLGINEVNSYIYAMGIYAENEAYVIYDYSFAVVDLLTGETLKEVSLADNIWDSEFIWDIDGDGNREVALTCQDGKVYFVSGTDLSVITVKDLGHVLAVPSYEWDENESYPAKMNVYDLAFINNTLYVTSEDGYLYVAQNTEDIKEIKMSIVTDEFFAQVLQSQLQYNGSGYEYTVTGVTSANFYSYQIVDFDEDYLLVGIYLGNKENASEGGSGITPGYGLVNVKTGEVSLVEMNDYRFNSGNICFGQYNGQKCVTYIDYPEDKACKIVINDLEGNLLYQKMVDITLFNSNASAYHLSYEDERYFIQLFNYGVCYLSANLADVEYCYTNNKMELLSELTDSLVFATSENGTVNKLECYLKDLETIKWSYEVKPAYKNKGLEFVKADEDFNGDGVNDVIGLVNYYDKKDTNVSSYLLIVDGTNGKEIFNNRIRVGTTYNDKGKPVPQYLTTDEIELIKDLNGDKKCELAADGYLISSKTFKPAGYYYVNIAESGNLLAVGDINNDGIEDYVNVTDKLARLYTSKVKVSGNNITIDFTKTKVTANLTEKLKNNANATLFGDVNNDGIKEIVVLTYNDKKNQTFTILDGKTLSTILVLLPDGVKDYGEYFTVTSFDFNGDGYNEIYGNDGIGFQGFIDGKTGEYLYYFNRYSGEIIPTDEYEGGKFNDDWHPEYIVPFNNYFNEEQLGFASVNDCNGDGIIDLLTSYYSFNPEEGSKNIIAIYSGKDLSPVKTINVGEAYVDVMGISEVKNSNGLYLISINNNTQLLDFNTGKVIAQYLLDFKAGYKCEDNILVVDDNNIAYIVKDSKTFVVDENTMADNILSLKWSFLSENSVMSIYDNGTLVYKGAENSANIRLVEGTHTITLEVSDGRYSTSIETLEVEAIYTKSNKYYVIAIMAVGVLTAVYANRYRKSYVRKGSKGVK